LAIGDHWRCGGWAFEALLPEDLAVGGIGTDENGAVERVDAVVMNNRRRIAGTQAVVGPNQVGCAAISTRLEGGELAGRQIDGAVVGYGGGRSGNPFGLEAPTPLTGGRVHGGQFLGRLQKDLSALGKHHWGSPVDLALPFDLPAVLAGELVDA